MMKGFLLSLSAILLFAGGSVSQAWNHQDSCKGLSEKAQSLIGQYKELRDRRSQLPPGKFDQDLSADGGKLHEVLSSLGLELGHPPYTKRDLIGCLGKPDAVRGLEQMRKFLEIYHREQRKAGRKVDERPDREYLIYFWRGWHDFLFFISEGGRIVDHGWWFAYE